MKKFLVLVMALCVVCVLGIAQAEGQNHGTVSGHAADCTWETDPSFKRIPCNDPACFVPDTCETTGKQAWHCSICGHVIEITEVNILTGHNYQDIPKLDPKCTEPGHEAYSVCTNRVKDYLGNEGDPCGAYKVVTDENGEQKELSYQEIPALGHTDPVPNIPDWAQYVLTFDCGDVVSDKAGVCERCGELLKDTITVVIDHENDVDVDAQAATCQSIGWDDYKQCGTCGVKKGYVEYGPIAHNWVFVEGTAGSCTENAWKDHYQCTMCHKCALKENGSYVIKAATDPSLSRPAPGHKTVPMTEVAATCTTTGLKGGEQCTVCGEIVTQQTVTPALTHDWEMVPGKKATCEEEGVVAHSECTRCDAIDGENTVIPAHGHVDQDGFWPERPTEARTAEATLSDYPLVPARDEPKPDGKPNTCTEDGYNPALYCPWCGQERVAKEILPKTGHDWKIETVGTMPTCTADGTADLWKCSNCGLEKGGDLIKALGHLFQAVGLTMPTCTEDGNYAFQYCVRENCPNRTNFSHYAMCYAEYIDVDIDDDFFTGHANIAVPPHNISAFWVAVTENGNVVHNDNTIIAALDHGRAYGFDDYIKQVNPVAPTCTETGRDGNGEYCELCETVFKPATVLPARGHQQSADQPAVEPTCTTDGNEKFWYCTRIGCNYSETVPSDHAEPVSGTIEKDEHGNWDGNVPAFAMIGQLGHLEKAGIASDPTCTKPGTTAGVYCDRCGVTLVEETVLPALGHDMSVVLDEGTPATCTEAGTTPRLKCSRCDLQEGGDTIDRLKHLYNEESYVAAVEPTCEEVGYTQGVRCSRCWPDYAKSEGWAVYPDVVPALGHDWKYAENLNEEATCENPGYKDYNCCKRCHLVVGEELGLADHKWMTFDRQEPTCTKPGVDGAKTCEECGYTMPQTIVPALGHDFQEYRAGDAPTCTAEGWTVGIKCTRCDEPLVESVLTDALGHDMQHVDAKPATCTTEGNKGGLACSRCEHKLGCEVIPAKGHTPGDWVVEIEPTYDEYGLKIKYCTECGEAQEMDRIPKLTNGLRGDVNMDGKVSLADVLEVLKYILGESDSQFADVNGDGVVTLSDAFAVLDLI